MRYAGDKLEKLLRGKALTEKECKHMIGLITSGVLGRKTDFVLGAFACLSQRIGPTMNMLHGIVDQFDECVTGIPIVNLGDEKVILAVGSGKDQFKTINVTTAAALVASSCGAFVAKIGGRAESSTAGSADILQFLGLNIDPSFEKFVQSLNKFGFGYFNPTPPLPILEGYLGKSPVFNVMEYVIPLYLGINIKRIMYGLADPRTNLTAQLMFEHGHGKSLVVCGSSNDGRFFDEISNLGPTIVSLVSIDGIQTLRFSPSDFSVPRSMDNEVSQPKSVSKCAEGLVEILKGQAPQAHLNLVCMNASALLWMAGITNEIGEGTHIAFDAIKRGIPWKLFKEIRNALR